MRHINFLLVYVFKLFSGLGLGLEYVVLSARFLNCTLLRPFVRGVDPVPSHPIPSRPFAEQWP